MATSGHASQQRALVVSSAVTAHPRREGAISATTTTALAQYVFAAPKPKKRTAAVLEEDRALCHFCLIPCLRVVVFALVEFKFTAPSHRSRSTRADYTAVLEHIVERDFFPDLARLRHAAAHLSASSSSASASSSSSSSSSLSSAASSASARIGALSTGTRRLLAGEETPSPALDSSAGLTSIVAANHSSAGTSFLSASSSSSDVAGMRVPAALSLGQFLESYTSEDNASFGEIMDAAAVRHREKNAWAYVEEYRALERSEQRRQSVQLLRLAGPAGHGSGNGSAADDEALRLTNDSSAPPPPMTADVRNMSIASLSSPAAIGSAIVALSSSSHPSVGVMTLASSSSSSSSAGDGNHAITAYSTTQVHVREENLSSEDRQSHP
jgi:hypothetical protein